MKTNHILLAILIFTPFFGCQSDELKALPDELVGVWRTSAEKYDNVYLELTKDLIVFANEDFLEKIDNNFISKIEQIQVRKENQKKKDILYIIHYENDEGLKYQISFYYDPSEGGVIRLKNQEKIEWRK